MKRIIFDVLFLAVVLTALVVGCGPEVVMEAGEDAGTEQIDSGASIDAGMPGPICPIAHDDRWCDVVLASDGGLKDACCVRG